jgi:hypothetical protein
VVAYAKHVDKATYAVDAASVEAWLEKCETNQSPGETTIQVMVVVGSSLDGGREQW